MTDHHEAHIRTIDFLQSPGASRKPLPEGGAPRPISLPTVVHLVGLVDATGGLVIGITLGLGFAPAPFLSLYPLSLFACLATIMMSTVGYLIGAYRREMLRSVAASIARALVSWAVAMAVVFPFALAILPASAAVREWLTLWALGTAALLGLSRCAFGLLARQWRRAGRLQRNAVILGAGPIGQRLIQKLISAPDSEVRIAGVYDDRTTRMPRSCLGHPIRGNVDDLVREARATRVDCVFVALPLSAEWQLAEIMNKLCLIPVDVRLCVDNFGFQIGRCDVTHVGGLTTLNVRDRPLKGWRQIAKAVEDRVLATIILAVAAPAMAVVAVLIKLDSSGPILFRQKRHGLNNELIEVLKFRSLYDDARDPNAERLCGSNDPRVTRVGAILRRTMIDELPQFINVLRGEMSIVGPRPHALAAKAGGLLYREVVKYYDARHRMKPGITGWAQINGWRGETRTLEEIDQRVAHDLYYIQNWSILFDLKIILWTAAGAIGGLLSKKSRNPADNAVSLANLGRSRPAA